MGRKTTYVILVLVTVYLEIMYDSTWLLLLLGTEGLLAAGLFLLSFYFRKNIHVRMEMNIPLAAKNEEAPLELWIENKGILPVSEIQILAGYENKYGECQERYILEEKIEGRTEKKRCLSVKSAYSGRVRFFIQNVYVWDYLRLFRRKWKKKDSAQEVWMNILPDIVEMKTVVTMRTQNFPAEGEEYEQNRSGDDPSEIFQIREFRGGDRLQSVHWKMSARMENWMTKEYSMPKGCKVLFLLDFCCPENGRRGNSRKRNENQEKMLEKMDCFLQTALSACFSMAEAGCIHYAAWYDADEQQMARYRIRKEEDVYTMLDLFLAAPVYTQTCDLEAAYMAQWQGSAYSTVLSLDLEGHLRCNGKEIGYFAHGAADGQAGFVLEV